MPRIQDTLIDVLQIVRHNLDAAIDQLAPAPGDFVVLSNIAFAENPTLKTPGVQDKVVITLVKTEEESALKKPAGLPSKPCQQQFGVPQSAHFPEFIPPDNGQL